MIIANGAEDDRLLHAAEYSVEREESTAIKCVVHSGLGLEIACEKGVVMQLATQSAPTALVMQAANYRSMIYAHFVPHRHIDTVVLIWWFLQSTACL